MSECFENNPDTINEAWVGNIPLPEGHTQVCTWPGTVIEKSEIEDFENWMETAHGVRVKFLETIRTKANKDGPGGRLDAFFSLHEADVGKFPMIKLKIGARWIEDAVAKANGGNTLYPQRVFAYRCWNADTDDGKLA